LDQLQHWFTQLVSDAAGLIPLGYAFGAGMVSAVNPCGFAMLPAYLGLYLGIRERTTQQAADPGEQVGTQVGKTLAGQLMRALLVASAVTAGFVFLFGGVGIGLSAGGQLIVRAVPWVALGIGLAMAVLGVALLSGRRLSVGLMARLGDRLGDPRTANVRGFFLFGLAYAVCSLSCTLPVFLTVVGSALTGRGFAASVVPFVSYALGMGLVILTLTVSLALFKGVLVNWLRASLPYVERLSAALLIASGGYIVYYWLLKGGLIETFR